MKSKTMAGFRAPYVPGWDCHGLPIETQVEKELGREKGQGLSGGVPAHLPRIRSALCGSASPRFQAPGGVGPLGRSLPDDEPHYEASIADAFLTFLEKGYVYRGLKPVYWCIHDRTALAEAEVEYEDHTSPSIWVRYRSAGVGQSSPQIRQDEFYALVWTTTPWTLPASMALAFHPSIQVCVGDG